MTGIISTASPAKCAGRRNGTSRPSDRPTAAISSSSVDKIVRSRRRTPSAAAAVYARSGRPASMARFLRGIDFEPPRAGIRPTTSSDPIIEPSAEREVANLPYGASVRDPLLHRDRSGRQHLGDARPGASVAIDRIGRIATVRDLPGDRGRNSFALVRCIDDVVAAFAAELACPDIDDRRSDEGAFPYAARRVADQTGGSRHQPNIGVDRQILEE